MKPDEIYNTKVGKQYIESLNHNFHKIYVEKSTLLAGLGDIVGKKVLDLDCGDGYYSRLMSSIGAKEVLGIDSSIQMIENARQHEFPRKDGSLAYKLANVIGYDDSKEHFDIVTTQYLFPYAKTKEELQQMIVTAYNTLKPGGMFVGVTTWSGGERKRPRKADLPLLGFRMKWEGIDQGKEIHDGILVNLTLLDRDKRETVTLPNYLWSQETIQKCMFTAGFSQVEWLDEKCQNDVPESARRWIAEAKQEFGLHGFFKAKKGFLVSEE